MNLPKIESRVPKHTVIVSTETGGRLSIHDFVKDGKLEFSNHTVEQYLQLHPHCRVMDHKEATDAQRAYYIKPVSEIDEEKFMDKLEVLPPCKWHRSQYFECFHISETLIYDIVMWVARVGERYFMLDDTVKLTPAQICERCEAFMEKSNA